jgi:peroxiredoxin
MKRFKRISGPIVIALALLMTALAAEAGRGLVGGDAPDFVLPSADGSNRRLSEYHGDVVMLNFWATWCGPCRQEMPQLEKIYERYEPAGFTLLGINVDADSEKAARMAESVGVSFPVLFDEDKSVSKLYDIRAMPVTVMIDRDGRVREVHHGYRPGVEASYLDQVRDLLRED